ncbi:MAG: hypothetical protein ACTSUT_12065 [Promethearchaeota archaeon]
MSRSLTLELVQILQGSLSLIFVVLSLIVGITILLKYFTYKERVFALMGFSWMGLPTPYYPDAINFVLIVVFNATSDSIPPLGEVACFIIGYALIPIFLLSWLTALTDFLYKNKQKIILAVFLIISVIFEAFFFYYLFTDLSLIGIFITPFQIRWSIFMELYLLSIILVFIVTGSLFASKSFKSESAEVRLKGRFLLAAFISFTIGAIIEALMHLDPITVIITRSILISSAIEFYLGFILPDWLKNRLLKEE